MYIIRVYRNITYDEIGNPLTYGDITYSWQNGRQLKEYKDGSQTISYKYNDDGIRISKKINDKEYKYYLDDDNIIYEETPNGIIYYIYNDDELIGFEYNNKTYYYEKNQQSDIIGLLNDEFNEIATYTYDSFGKILSIKDSDGKEITNKNNIALINPFRYRSYYYDSETNLYYLNSRYYNPEMGRFINADGTTIFETDGGNQLNYNLYAYGLNNPINTIDEDGDIAWIAVGFALWAVYDIYVAVKEPTKENIFYAAIGVVPFGKISKLFKLTKKFKVTPRASKKAKVSQKAVRVRKPYFNGVSTISKNRMHHIMQSKHLWKRITSSERKIKDIINLTIRKGTWSVYGSAVMVQYKYKGKLITVTGKVVKEKFRISSAWVNG